MIRIAPPHRVQVQVGGEMILFVEDRAAQRSVLDALSSCWLAVTKRW
jgi:hypothetical protein